MRGDDGTHCGTGGRPIVVVADGTAEQTAELMNDDGFDEPTTDAEADDACNPYDDGRAVYARQTCLRNAGGHADERTSRQKRMRPRRGRGLDDG